MPTIHLTGKEPGVAELVRAAFPNYTGRKFRLEVSDHPINLASYWDGGSRDYFVLISLATLRHVDIPAQSAFDPQVRGLDKVTLPDGVACIEHSIFCGKDSGITIHVSPSNATPLLPTATDELTREERIVLSSTRSHKASYAGDSNIRFHEAQRVTGITQDSWTAAKASCQAKRLLNAAGALTIDGKNAIGWTDLHSLREVQS
jgi:hypothetical protein